MPSVSLTHEENVGTPHALRRDLDATARRILRLADLVGGGERWAAARGSPPAGGCSLPGTGFFVGGGGERNLRLAFSFVPPDEIGRGVSILAQAIGEMMNQGIFLTSKIKRPLHC